MGIKKNIGIKPNRALLNITWPTAKSVAVILIRQSIKEKNKTQDILRLAVKRMLPGGPLAKKQLTKLKIYSGDNHPHEVQQPKVINFEKLNKRNIIK